MASRLRIGELLVDAGLITAAQLEAALDSQREQGAGGRRLGQVIVDLGFVKEAQLARVLSQQLSVPWVSLSHIDFSRSLLALVPREIADRYCVIPVYIRRERGVGDTLYLAMDDPTYDDALRAVAEATAMPVKPMIAPPSDIRTAIEQNYDEVSAPVVPRYSPTIPESPRAMQQVAIRPTEPERPTAKLEAAKNHEAELSAPKRPPPPPPPLRPSQPDRAPPTAIAEPAKTPVEVTPEAKPEEAKPEAPKLEEAKPAEVATPAEGSEAPAAAKPKRTRMIALTLLDGTAIAIPASRHRARTQRDPARAAMEGGAKSTQSGAEVLAATRAIIDRLKDSTKSLSQDEREARWESLVSALLKVLLRKGLMSEREFLDALREP